MYDFYLSRKENNYYEKGENAAFTTVNGEKVIETFDLPATRQKSYYGKSKNTTKKIPLAFALGISSVPTYASLC